MLLFVNIRGAHAEFYLVQSLSTPAPPSVEYRAPPEALPGDPTTTPRPQSFGSSNSCQYAHDGECDEPDLCSPGTDSDDCSMSFASPNSCQHAHDGECDEPDLCSPGTDRDDCSMSFGSSIAANTLTMVNAMSRTSVLPALTRRTAVILQEKDALHRLFLNIVRHQGHFLVILQLLQDLSRKE
jgi:hypothetical protein